MIFGACCRARVAVIRRLACASVGVALWSGVARATPILQGTAESSAGYTDNLESSPNVAIAGIPAKSPGVLVQLSPSLMLSLSTPRAIQRLAYTFTYILVVNNLSQNSSANRLDYQAFFDVSPRATLLVDANVVQSNTDTATGLGQGALLPGPTSYVSGTSNELLSLSLTARWRTWAAAQVLGQVPLSSGENPETGSLAGLAGIERAWRTRALGVEARSNYTVIVNSLLLDGAPAGPQEQLTNVGVVQFRQDLGQHFTSSLEAGGMRVDRLNTGAGFWAPAGAAALTYTNDVGEIELSYNHAMTSNPLLGQYLLVDEARLRAAIPLIRAPELLLTGSGGYQFGQLLDENDNVAAHVNTLLIDAGLRYQVTESLFLGVRYQHIERWSDVVLPPLPLSFTRNTAMLTATFKWPPDVLMPRRYRAPRRVDRTDEIRDNAAASDP
jgi:hypothetical protein